MSMVAINNTAPMNGGHVVRRPRRSDAIGSALRGAFAQQPLPDDLMRLLRRLDG